MSFFSPILNGEGFFVNLLLLSLEYFLIQAGLLEPLHATYSCVISGFFKSFLYDLAVFRSHLFQPEEKNEIILYLSLRLKRRHIRQTTQFTVLTMLNEKSLLATSAVLKYCLC